MLDGQNIAAQTIILPNQFNAAALFLDRNVAEGRGDCIAVVSRLARRFPPTYCGAGKKHFTSLFWTASARKIQT